MCRSISAFVLPPARHSFPTRRSSDLGSDLLFQALRLSTIGAGEFNGRVRDGIGYRLPANTTRSAKNGKRDRKSTRLNSSHMSISYAVFCLKKNIVRLAGDVDSLLSLK